MINILYIYNLHIPLLGSFFWNEPPVELCKYDSSFLEMFSKPHNVWRGNVEDPDLIRTWWP